MKRNNVKKVEKEGFENKRSSSLLDIYDIIFLAVMVAHILAAPHTKVEETFQVNNIYDHLFLQDKLIEYDYIEFPGVVYRTFISSLLIAFFNYPAKLIFDSLGVSCFYLLITCNFDYSSFFLARLTLGLMNFISLKLLRNAVDDLTRDYYISRCFMMVSNNCLNSICIDLCSLVSHYVLPKQTFTQYFCFSLLQLSFCLLALK